MKAYVVQTEALVHNLAVLRQRARCDTIWAVVKGNGYGLGTGSLSRLLWENGIHHFAVTALSEAQAVRQAGLEQAEILMLEGSCNREELGTMLELGVLPTVGSPESLAAVAAAAEELDVTARVHLKIDTGMGRFGFLPEQAEFAAQLVGQQPRIQVAGVYTHFYEATNAAVTQRQYAAFSQAVNALREARVDTGMVHCCNSTAFWLFPQYHWDAVRLGSAILGRVAFSEPTQLRSIGYCEAELEEIRMLPKGHTVGYGGSWVAKRDTRIAVLGVGYFHGFGTERGFDLWRLKDCLRGVARYIKAFLKRKALYVQVNGKACRVLGHVGMVNMVIDVTDCPCQVGDLARVEINPLLVKGMEVRYTRREDL